MGATITITRNTTLPDSAEKADFHNLVDTATATIAAIADTEVVALDSCTRGDVLVGNSSAAWSDLAKGTTGQFLRMADGNDPGWSTDTAALEYVIDGGDDEIEPGVKGDLVVPFKCTLTGVTLLADQTGSIQVDLWKDTYANYPPINADSMTDSGTTPVISAATKSQDTTLTSFTTAITANDIIRFNVDSCSTITRCVVILHVNKIL